MTPPAVAPTPNGEQQALRGRSARTIFRAGLVNRLRVARRTPFVVVTAPPGYGKSSLIADWALRDGRRFIWDLASADAYETVAHLSGAETVIVLDDVDTLRDTDLLALLSEALAPGSQLVLVGRGEPPLPLARLRAYGAVLELGVDELRFTDREAAALLRSAGLDAGADTVRRLNERAEGWPAGLGLAAEALRTGADETMLAREYFRREVFPRLHEHDLDFLRRAAVLERLSGPLCDAVLGSTASALLLEQFERANLFLVPLDRERLWYRLHPTFRAVLLAELDPATADDVRRQASVWHEKRGRIEDAIAYAYSAHELERVADLVAGSVLPFTGSAPAQSTERWLAALDDEALLERNPTVAAVGALAHAFAGRAEVAERWAGIATRERKTRARKGAVIAPETWNALLRTTLGTDGLRDDAEAALDGLKRGSPWRIPALLSLAEAARLDGDTRASDDTFAVAVEEAKASRLPTLTAVALAFRSLLASAGGEWERAESFATAAERAVRSAKLENDPPSACTYAACARVALRQGDWTRFRMYVTLTEALVPRLTHALSWIAVEIRLELARIHAALHDPARALELLDEVDAILAGSTHGALLERAHDVRAGIAAVPTTEGATLTAAELRLLPLLTTHLSFREIAERLYVSRNTVKTQAISVYRKLGVSARGEAIARAAEMGLVGDRER